MIRFLALAILLLVQDPVEIEERYTLTIRAKSRFLHNEKIANVNKRLNEEMKAIKVVGKTAVPGDNAGWEDWELSISDQRKLDFMRFKDIFSILPINQYKLKIIGTAEHDEKKKTVTLNCAKAGMKLKLANRPRRADETEKPPDLLAEIVARIKEGKTEFRVAGLLTGLEAATSIIMDAYDVIERPKEEKKDPPKEPGK